MLYVYCNTFFSSIIFIFSLESGTYIHILMSTYFTMSLILSNDALIIVPVRTSIGFINIRLTSRVCHQLIVSAVAYMQGFVPELINLMLVRSLHLTQHVCREPTYLL